MSTTSALSTSPDQEIGRVLGLGQHRRGRRWLWRALGLGVAFAVAAALVVGLRSSGSKGPAYETRAAERRDLQVAVTASGTLEPSTTVEIGPEISGRVRAVHVDYNDRVARDQVLVELDTDLLKAQLAQADSQVGVGAATLDQARASDAEARATLERGRALAAQRLISDAELDATVAAARRASGAATAAAAQLRSAQAAQTMARTNLDKATIRSPIDGVVLARSVDVGQTVVAALLRAGHQRQRRARRRRRLRPG